MKYWEENIELVKKMRKEKKQALKERKRKEKERRELEEEGLSENKSEKSNFKNPKSRKFREELNEKLKTAHPIILDCSFSKQHNDKEEKALINQLTQILGSNRKYEKPLKIYLTGVSEDFKERIKNNNGDKWILGGGVFSESYLDLEIMGLKGEELKKKMVYLTGDAEESMEGFEEG